MNTYIIHSVTLGISDYEDPELVGVPVLRVHGTVNGIEFCLPPENLKDVLSIADYDRIEKMIRKLKNQKED
jgi:hypothetical protein